MPEALLNSKEILNDVGKENLSEQIKELQDRIAELEEMLSSVMAPLKEMTAVSQNYVRLLNLALSHGGLSVDMLVPEIKDSISREIIKALVDKKGRNISQITEAVRSARGSASRRIIRDRLKELEELGVVRKDRDAKITVYYLTERVLRKWSEVLGINISSDQPRD